MARKPLPRELRTALMVRNIVGMFALFVPMLTTPYVSGLRHLSNAVVVVMLIGGALTLIVTHRGLVRSWPRSTDSMAGAIFGSLLLVPALPGAIALATFVAKHGFVGEMSFPAAAAGSALTFVLVFGGIPAGVLLKSDLPSKPFAQPVEPAPTSEPDPHTGS